MFAQPWEAERRHDRAACASRRPATAPASSTSPRATTSACRARTPRAMSTDLVRPVATLGFLAAATQARAAHVVRLDPAVSPSAADGEGVHDARRAVGRPRHPRRAAPAISRPSSRRSASTSRSAASCSTRRSTWSCRRSSTNIREHDGPTWHGARRRPAPAAGAAAAAADLDRRQHAGGAQARRRARRRLAAAGHVPRSVARRRSRPSASTAKRLRGDEPIEIGANSPWLYVGKPAFEMPAGLGHRRAARRSRRRCASSRPWASSMCGVRFRSRSCDELCDQIDAFGREVAPADSNGVTTWMLLKGRVAIVSGIGPGVGKEVALAFAREGADVVLAARTASGARGGGARRSRSAGQKALCVPTDIAEARRLPAPRRARACKSSGASTCW